MKARGHCGNTLLHAGAGPSVETVQWEGRVAGQTELRDCQRLHLLLSVVLRLTLITSKIKMFIHVPACYKTLDMSV